MNVYKHKSIQKLAGLHEAHKERMGEGFGWHSMLWKSISPTIPLILQQADNDESFLAKARGFLKTIMDALDEDLSEPAEQVTITIPAEGGSNSAEDKEH